MRAYLYLWSEHIGFSFILRQKEDTDSTNFFATLIADYGMIKSSADIETEFWIKKEHRATWVIIPAWSHEMQTTSARNS